MALQSNALRTPSWMRAELAVDARTLDERLNVGVRCKDGWAHIVTLSLPRSFANGDILDVSRAEVYTVMHQFITKQLAIETLENT